MINELEVQKFDNIFGTKSKVFKTTNIIIVNTFLDEWMIKITSRRDKPICLFHKNKRNRTNKYHLQGRRNTLYQAYDSIYSHKNPLRYKNKVNGIK
jgi:hypothetical protein